MISAMPKSKAVDTKIAEAAVFARPVLEHLRGLVHRAGPVEETVKWGRPFFLYKGSMLCFMSAFTKHCSFGFWSQAIRKQLQAAGIAVEESSGILGKITSLDDLPKDAVLLKFLREAMREIDVHGKAAARPPKRAARAELPVPPGLAAALKKNKAAAAAFKGLPPSHRREYCEWVGKAKREETRAKRAATAVEWIAEGKSRNWKYER
jgi:uncharacterized protein YdeI (YjbR/CyaY-like superfamily)